MIADGVLILSKPHKCGVRDPLVKVVDDEAYVERVNLIIETLGNTQLRVRTKFEIQSTFVLYFGKYFGLNRAGRISYIGIVPVSGLFSLLLC